jgi:hypothetical protein
LQGRASSGCIREVTNLLSTLSGHQITPKFENEHLSAQGRGQQPDVESLKQDSKQQSLSNLS